MSRSIAPILNVHGPLEQPVKGSRNLNNRSRKTMWLSACAGCADGLLFPPRRRGNPTAGRISRKLLRRRSEVSRETGGPEVKPEVSRETGRRKVPGGKQTGNREWNVQPEPAGNWWHRRSRDRRGSFGIVEGKPARRPQGLQSAPETGAKRSSDRSRRLRPTATSERSWVPGPTTHGRGTPRGLRLRPRLPRGFLASGLGCVGVVGFSCLADSWRLVSGPDGLPRPTAE